MIWYKTIMWNNEIYPVEVEKHTDSFVWIKGRRHSISSKYANYYPTFLAAKTAKQEKAKTIIDKCKRQIAEQEKILKELDSQTINQ